MFDTTYAHSSTLSNILYIQCTYLYSAISNMFQVKLHTRALNVTRRLHSSSLTISTYYITTMKSPTLVVSVGGLLKNYLLFITTKGYTQAKNLSRVKLVVGTVKFFVTHAIWKMLNLDDKSIT